MNNKRWYDFETPYTDVKNDLVKFLRSFKPHIDFEYCHRSRLNGIYQWCFTIHCSEDEIEKIERFIMSAYERRYERRFACHT